MYVTIPCVESKEYFTSLNSKQCIAGSVHLHFVDVNTSMKRV